MATRPKITLLYQAVHQFGKLLNYCALYFFFKQYTMCCDFSILIVNIYNYRLHVKKKLEFINCILFQIKIGISFKQCVYVFKECDLRKIHIYARHISLQTCTTQCWSSRSGREDIERFLSNADFHMNVSRLLNSERGDMKAKKTDINWKAIYAMLISAHMKVFIIIKYLSQLLRSIL